MRTKKPKVLYMAEGWDIYRTSGKNFTLWAAVDGTIRNATARASRIAYALNFYEAHKRGEL